MERYCTGPFEGPPTIKPPARPEDIYFRRVPSGRGGWRHSARGQKVSTLATKSNHAIALASTRCAHPGGWLGSRIWPFKHRQVKCRNRQGERDQLLPGSAGLERRERFHGLRVRSCADSPDPGWRVGDDSGRSQPHRPSVGLVGGFSAGLGGNNCGSDYHSDKGQGDQEVMHAVHSPGAALESLSTSESSDSIENT